MSWTSLTIRRGDHMSDEQFNLGLVITLDGAPGVWQWLEVEKQLAYGSSKTPTLFVGRWKVGAVEYVSLRTKGDPLAYEAQCHLPGLKKSLGRFETAEAAKSAVERAVKYWFDNLSTAPRAPVYSS